VKLPPSASLSIKAELRENALLNARPALFFVESVNAARNNDILTGISMGLINTREKERGRRKRREPAYKALPRVAYRTLGFHVLTKLINLSRGVD